MKLGVSAYVGLVDHPIEKTIDFLKMAKRYGIEYVFTSCHIPESKIVDDFLTLLRVVEELQLKLIIDVSKPMMEHFVVPENTYALRLDWGFSREDMVEMSRKLDCYIELNASIVSNKALEQLIEMGVNPQKLRVSFNFYPKKYTGMALETVIEKTILFKQYDIEVMGYIPSLNGARPPMCEGLPTIESHRDKPLDIAIMEFLVAGVDAVVVGDSYPSETELKMMSAMDFSAVHIPLVLRENITETELEILKRNHRSRIDESPYMIRSSTRIKENIKLHDNVDVSAFDVTIDNHLYLRYQGEVGIAKKAMPLSERVNVVGFVPAIGHDLVRTLKPGTPFKFDIYEKK